MSINASAAAPNVITLDPGTYPDGVFRIRVNGDAADRLQIHADGSIYAGNGESAPEELAGPTLADLFPDAPVEVDPASEDLAGDLFTALETLGLIAAPEV